jgi:hypothetical protein
MNHEPDAHGHRRRSLRVFQESEIEGGKHQDDADVHHQPFPESIPKEH